MRPCLGETMWIIIKSLGTQGKLGVTYLGMAQLGLNLQWLNFEWLNSEWVTQVHQFVWKTWLLLVSAHEYAWTIDLYQCEASGVTILLQKLCQLQIDYYSSRGVLMDWNNNLELFVIFEVIEVCYRFQPYCYCLSCYFKSWSWKEKSLLE